MSPANRLINSPPPFCGFGPFSVGSWKGPAEVHCEFSARILAWIIWCEFWAVSFLRVTFGGALFGGKNWAKIWPQNSAPICGAQKFTPQNSTPNSGSWGARSPQRKLAPGGKTENPQRIGRPHWAYKPQKERSAKGIGSIYHLLLLLGHIFQAPLGPVFLTPFFEDVCYALGMQRFFGGEKDT